MKKLVALLLALLLPVCALADTFEVTMEVQTAQALFSALVNQSVQKHTGLEGVSSESVAKLLQALLGNTKITAVTQENASAVSITLNGNSFLDATIYLSGEESLMTSSLIPGYVLVEDVPSASAAEAENEKKIAEDVQNAFVAWKETLPVETVHGVFSGDAYTGGTVCTTWTITDSDIAALMTAIMTPELREMIEQHVEAAGEDGILSAFDAANARVTEENKYTYTIRCVADDEDRLIGVSATVLDEAAQVATFSLGVNDQNVRVVIGLGLKQENYWAECVLTESQRDQTTFIKGEMREWTADKSESFAYVTEANAPAMSYLLNCIMTKSGQRELWDGHVYLGTKAIAGKEVLSFSGSMNKANQSFEAQCSLVENQQSMMTFSLSKKPAAEIMPPDASLVRCAETDPDQGELYEKVNQELVFAITMRLMQIIPFDLLLKMDGLTQ